jgi:hypothetical protein
MFSEQELAWRATKKNPRRDLLLYGDNTMAMRRVLAGATTSTPGDTSTPSGPVQRFSSHPFFAQRFNPLYRNFFFYTGQPWVWMWGAWWCWRNYGGVWHIEACGAGPNGLAYNYNPYAPYGYVGHGAIPYVGSWTW